MMVLDAYQGLTTFTGLGIVGGEVVRVQIKGYHLRFDGKELTIVLYRILKGYKGFQVLKIPQVVGEHHQIFMGQAEGALQFSPAGQQGPLKSPGDRYRHR